MSTPLSALVNLISINVAALEAAYTEKGASFPSLDDLYQPSPLDFDPALAQTKSVIVAAAAQLLATVRLPFEALHDYAPGAYFTSTLGFAVESNIPDIIQELGGPQGAHVKDISARNGVDASYSARILRFLATRHIFREVTPDVFANNKLSSLLLKNKSIAEIEADPLASFDAGPFAGYVSAAADESLASSKHLREFLQNPKQAAAPFNIAFKTDAKLWEWYEEPGNELRNRRFSSAMKGGAADRYPAELFIHGSGLKDLNDGDVVVDVGGSLGTCTFHFYKAFPNLKYVVQDLDKVILSAEDFWKENAPEAVSSDKVKLQAHNFFTPQPVKGAALYFLRVVVHDWPDHDAKNILKHLRDAANESSKLVLFDTLAYHVCEDPVTEIEAPRAPAPFPLLANLGIAQAGFDTGLDMQMLHLFNGKERNEEEFRQLGLSVGWKLESIVRGPLNAFTFSAV
ncbi:hypothetical protein H0H87_002544 [Tephrocybe sp. NHM501043]|nr:hypothetical protein H0H87_002544 [Tephrocybe sp. NHM501043]